MKILLVEDEIKFRHHIREMLIQLGYEDIVEADNGEQALYLLSSKKMDIVISDIEMPLMDGLTLLSTTKKTESKEAFFIILSAFDSFEYAQIAIKNGAFSYMLKPIKDSDLESVLTLCQAKLQQKKEVESSRHQLVNAYNNSIQLQSTELFTTIVNNDNLDYPYINSRLSKLSIHPRYNSYQIILINIDRYNTSTTAVSYQDEDLYRFSISNIITEILVDTEYYLYYFTDPRGNGFIINHDNPLPFGPSHPLYKLLFQAKGTIESLLNIAISISTSPLVSSMEHLYSAYQLAYKAMAQKLINNGGLYFIDTENTSSNFSYVIGFNEERRLLGCFETNDVKEARTFIVEIFAPIMTLEQLNLKKLHNFIYQIILLLFKITKQFKIDPDDILGDEYILYTEVIKLNSIEEMIQWFIHNVDLCFTKLNEKFNNSNTGSIYNAKTYIDSNYGLELTLESVASHIYMSPEHFSRLFKKTFNDNFINYLTTVRIAKAKELLLNTNLKIIEIAKNVGFNDTKYFSKVFKSHTKVTPSIYRHLNGID